MLYIYFINFFLAIATAFSMSVTSISVAALWGVGTALLVDKSAEFLADLTRYPAGVIYDKSKKKKYIFLGGSVLAFLSKIFLFVPNVYCMLFAKYSERFSNGLIGTPKNAYAGDIIANSDEEYRQRKDARLNKLILFKTVGCITGSAIAGILTHIYGDLRNIAIEVTVLLAFITFLACVLSYFIKNPHKISKEDITSKFTFSNIKELKYIYFVYCVFFVGRFTDAVLALYLKKIGFNEAYCYLPISIFNFAMLLYNVYLFYRVKQKPLNAKNMLYVACFSMVMFNSLFLTIQSNDYILATFAILFWGIQRTSVELSFSVTIANNVKTDILGRSLGFGMMLQSFVGILMSFFYRFIIDNFCYAYVFIFSIITSIATICLNRFLVKKQ